MRMIIWRKSAPVPDCFENTGNSSEAVVRDTAEKAAVAKFPKPATALHHRAGADTVMVQLWPQPMICGGTMASIEFLQDAFIHIYKKLTDVGLGQRDRVAARRRVTNRKGGDLIETLGLDAEFGSTTEFPYLSFALLASRRHTRRVGGLLRPSLPPSDLDNFLFLSSWPKQPSPSCWPVPSRQECAACASTFVLTRCPRMSPGVQPSSRLTWLR